MNYFYEVFDQKYFILYQQNIIIFILFYTLKKFVKPHTERTRRTKFEKNINLCSHICFGWKNEKKTDLPNLLIFWNQTENIPVIRRASV